MKVGDLDRNMTDVIPTGTSLDSQFLFERMTEVTLSLTKLGPGKKILDVASGFGQDTLAIAERGAFAIGCEPSERMLAWARLKHAQASEPVRNATSWVQGWSNRMPFATGSFDAVFCKGSIDHFDAPRDAIGEMARVAKLDGRVVLAIANFDSLACRLARALDDVQEDWLKHGIRRGRRHYDVPSDHFTRYDLELMKAQFSCHVEIEVLRGVSLLWGFFPWNRAIGKVPERVAWRCLRALDRVAASAPFLADVVVLAGRPRGRTRKL